MKLTVTAVFDPMHVSPKDIQEALLQTGLTAEEIEIKPTRVPRRTKEGN